MPVSEVKPAPKPAPKPHAWAPSWPLDVRRVHVVWGKVHPDLPSLKAALLAVMPLSLHGNRVEPAPPQPEHARGPAKGLTLASINARGGASVGPAAMRVIEDGVIGFTEFVGLLAARVSTWVEPPARSGDPVDLWVQVEVPILGATPGDVPSGLIPAPRLPARDPQR